MDESRTPPPAAAFTEADAHLHFTPVPNARARHDGWSAERQRAFILALAESGVVSTAAKRVGMSVTSAYNLRKRDTARSFAAAWDIALAEARDRALAYVMDHAINGATRPRFYRGSFIGSVHGVEDRMAIAALRATFGPMPAGARGRGKVER